jgi:integrase
MKATTAITLDRRAKKDGTRAVQLRITHERKQKYYSLGWSLTPEDFEKCTSGQPRGTHKEYKLRFAEKEKKAIQIIEEMPYFSFGEFKKRMFSKSKARKCAFDSFDDYIATLNEAGRISTASSYNSAKESLKKFAPKGHLRFTEITTDFLNKYERKMIESGNSVTTVGIYARSLRTVFNNAIADKVVSRECYPFGKHGYQIPAGRNIKKALPLEDIGKIARYQVNPVTKEGYYRDIWVFSYLCNGINMKDIARLKWKNIDGDTVNFIRSKTERTSKKNLKPINAHLVEIAKKILEKWGNADRNPDEYVFPILEANCSPEREYSLVRQFTKMVNRYVGRIAKACGIEAKVTTYTARHSCATILKRSGASIAYISEALGHKDLKTTESYLGSFEDKQRAEHAKALVAF